MAPDLLYSSQRDPVQYRPGVPRGVRSGSHKDEGEGTHAREIELKRSRGEISCAECRRLKIKCDRQLPCSSCLRRGCASLCPNGSLATGQGTRFVLAATDHLHKRMSKMSERIRQLEDALAIMQSNVSQESHPLLRDELLSLKVDKAPEAEPDPARETPKCIDGLGTLSISDKGPRFYGASGSSELMLMKDDDEERFSSPSASGGSPVSIPSSSSQHSSKSPQLQPEVALFSNAFPFTPIGPAHDMQAKIKDHLPKWDDAVKLAEVYLESAAWLFRSVSRDQLMDDMLPAIYHRSIPDPGHNNVNDYTGPHSLALLLMCFAIGTLVDITQEPYRAVSDHYYQLAKAAIVLQNVLEQPSLITVQTLHLMSIYNSMRQSDGRGDDSGTSMEMSWSLLRQAVQLGLTVYRDSARWGLGRQETERRRILFWDLFVADSWQSLACGRPPCITMPYVDCQFPQDEDARLNEKGKMEPGFGSWMFRFTLECVSEISAKTLTASVPPYSMILDLDAKLRDFPVPSFPDNIPVDLSKPAAVMARYVFSHARETILLNLHKGFFAQAMIDDPVNPLRSQYAPSFLATYRCSSHILKSIRDEFDTIPTLCARFWMPWTYAFSSAVVFGTIVVRGPSSSYAPSSLQELDKACELFSAASQHSTRAAKASAILEKLKVKAHTAYESCLRSKSMPELQAGDNQVMPALKLEKDDELDLFSGRVPLVSSKKGSSASGSSPDVRAAISEETPSPPPSYSKPSPSSPGDGTIRINKIQNPISPLGNAFAGGSQMHQLSALRSPESASPDSAYPPVTWAGAGVGPGFRDIYTEHGADTPGSFPVSSGSYPPTVKLDEWVAPSASRNPQSNSHSSNPDIGMDGMEYDHGRASVSSHQGYIHSHHQFSQPLQHAPPNQQPASRVFHPRLPSQLSHEVTDPRYHAAYAAPQPPPPSSNAPGTYYHPPGSGGTPPELYATAPREFAEMGLASHNSGLNQRWTSFMQDTGLFYGPTGGPM
ncbi:uncharacterized protein FOMMEDRAFT_131048 [Fomitiporia mediterranea MF3/22]|uniref:uncharacterized protein n=1 Tax=Fomitiporia mediterranea (strain MF3/22) TaxID=694068 RepID=UPI00044087F2|nr:uncharacterized protein FOMMEDRAFT_131048 [Fomitiporia mediterranea MF3/22]EJD08116.1 hypothetical protein FOMMEDRAFT_131048 [Fomitiporia mediterranea MF3/22]